MEPEDKLVIKGQDILVANCTANAPKEVKYRSLGQNMGIFRKPILIKLTFHCLTLNPGNICVNN